MANPPRARVGIGVLGPPTNIKPEPDMVRPCPPGCALHFARLDGRGDGRGEDGHRSRGLGRGTDRTRRPAHRLRRAASPRNGTLRHPTLPYAEVPAFLAHLSARSGVAALALNFTILTAARSGEVRGARWAEIDMENAVWTIPAPRMKAKKEHRGPLAPEAIAMLDRARGLDQDLLFRGQRPGRPMSDMTLAAVLKRIGRGDLTVHGFRSTFRDWAAERTNFPHEIAELCLARFVGNAVERAYRRSDLIDKRRALERDPN